MIGSLLGKIKLPFSKSSKALNERKEAIVSAIDQNPASAGPDLPPIIGAPVQTPAPNEPAILKLSAIFPQKSSAETVVQWSMHAKNCIDTEIEEGNQGIAIWSCHVRLAVLADATKVIELENTMRALAEHLGGQYSGSELLPVPEDLLSAEGDGEPGLHADALPVENAAMEAAPADTENQHHQMSAELAPASQQPVQPQAISGVAMAAEESMFGGEAQPVGGFRAA